MVISPRAIYCDIIASIIQLLLHTTAGLIMLLHCYFDHLGDMVISILPLFSRRGPNLVNHLPFFPLRYHVPQCTNFSSKVAYWDI